MSAPLDAAVAKRLQSELMSLMMANLAGISAFPQSDNMLSWVGTLDGAPGTVCEGLTYKLALSFPSNYPFTAPTIT
ncbi:Ubiquitin-conjugating enzyme E2 C, partial [Coemansia sp. RSA 1836]